MNNWEECLDNQYAKITLPDKERAKSLLETAEERISLISTITEKNCNFVFEDYYSSMIEILQALAFMNGYNILNHVCIGFYLRDVLKREDLFNMFDDLRYKRNSLMYYGTKMDFETAKSAIEKCKKLIKEIKLILKEVK